MLRRVRIISQIISFFLICAAFFFLIAYPHGYNRFSPFYLRLNPLTGLLTTVASRSFFAPVMLGLLVLAITIFFGRLFCGFFCPIGAIIDFNDRLLLGKLRVRNRPVRELQRLKFVILCAVGILAIFGIFLPLIVDPLLLFTRIFTLVVNPLLQTLRVDAIVTAAPLLRSAGWGHLVLGADKAPVYYGVAGVWVLMAVVLAGSLWDRRFWCQYVCPAGAFFGLVGRWAPLRRRVKQERCSDCGKCARRCPTRAIDPAAFSHTAVAECIVCGQCTADSRNCNAFGFGGFGAPAGAGPDLPRRHAIAGIAAGLSLLPVFRATATAKHDNTGRFLRPPGAVPEKQFLGRCLACGACMKVCPSNAIQPAGLSDGLHRIYTPKIVPRIGACEEKCHVCGHVCPTGAIRKLTYERKRFVKIGTAAIDQSRCLAWSTGKDCLVCDEVCPYNALEAQVIDFKGKKVGAPRIKAHLCLGCGLCEQHCPVHDDAAIRVFKSGENRRAAGPYISPARKRRILEQRRSSEVIDYHGNGTSRPEGKKPPPKAGPRPDSTAVIEETLPEGFILD